MDRFLLQILTTEVGMQCRFVLQGYDLYETELALSERKPTRDDWFNDPTVRPDYYIPRIWFAVQAILTASANASKLLWGDSYRDPLTRADLRAALEVGEGSCLEPMQLRNQFEHYDEKIQKWRDKQKGEVYVGRNIGSAPLPDSEDIFAHLDTSTSTVTFRKHKAVIVDLVAEAQRILPLTAHQL